jgi:Zn-finger nucleic acid-binding protein
MTRKRSPKAGVWMHSFITDEGVEIDICPLTKGIWLDLGELAAFTGLEADLPYFKDAVSHSRETLWPSPSAPCKLREIRFHPEHEVVIDYCPQSGGIWLDPGELDKLRTIASDIGSPQSKIMGVMKSMTDSVLRRSQPPSKG